MQPKTMPKLSPSFLPTLAVLIFFISFGADGEYDCEPTRCGVVQNISYPFWVSGAQSPHCGHPAFELNCEDDRRDLVLAKPFPRYGVGQIPNGDIRCFRFFSIEFITSKSEANDCPNGLSDGVSLDDLHIIQITKKLILLDCSSNAANEHDDCLTFVSSPYFALDYNNISWKRLDDPAKNHCKMQLTIPLLPYYQTESTLDICDLEKWSDPDDGKCSNCSSDSGGPSCFSHQSLPEAFCRCDDGPHRGNCNGSKERRWKKIVIGVSAGIAGLVAAGLLFFLYLHCRKTKQISSSSTLLSRTTPSDSLDSHKDPEIGDEQYHTQIFMYEELAEATDGFSASNELGDGGFGTVYKGKLRDGRTVAIKRFKNNYRRIDLFLNEVYILSSFRHENLVSLYGCTSRHARELLLVYEYVPNGTVADHLHGRRAGEEALTWPLRLRIAIEGADALRYLHNVTPPLIHRDVKTNNILLDRSFRVKVADFGLSKLFPVNATHVSTAPQGTPGYVDPEYHQCYMLTDKSDVYSFGVVLAELISSKPAVDVNREWDEINLGKMTILKIQDQKLDELIDPKLWFRTNSKTRTMIKQVAEVAFRCLQEEREMRPTIKEVLEALMEIEDEGGNVENGEEEGDAANGEQSLLSKSSLDTVDEQWESKSTTPNSASQ